MTRFRSGDAAFRPRARLLRLIGAELISDEVVAVTELVKNAHDADASKVMLKFHQVTKHEGEIAIVDDGDGMDLETVLGIWMEPGATSKGSASRHITPRGRRVLGEKGVGRFAVDKLARRLELVTRKAGVDEETAAIFDWDDFAAQSMLSEVKARWETRAPLEIDSRGTILRLSGLRSAWNERMFRRLCTRLSRLRSPFKERGGFSVVIESDEFPEYSGELRSDFLDRAPYCIDVGFDGLQTLDVTLGGRTRTKQPWVGSLLSCGPLRIKLFAFDLETESIASIGPRMEVRAWLKEWSGVSVYRDGFRIWPYGEPHDDWLRLDQRRVNNPVTRLSNNQIVGFVELSQDGNPELRDQTNREGLLHNEAFLDLRRLVYFALEILESERQSQRHPHERRPSRDAHSDRHDIPAVASSAMELATRAPKNIANDLRRIAKDIAAAAERDELLRRQHVNAFAELAAAARATGLLTLSIRKLVHDMQTACDHVSSTLSGARNRRSASFVSAIRTAVNDVDARLSEIMHASHGAKSRRAIDIVTELRRCRRALHPALSARGIDMQVFVTGARLLRTEMRPETFRHLIALIVENSIDWIKSVRGPRIRVTATVRRTRCEITVADNGPGIPDAFAVRVFEPYFSRKEGGRGLGLAIAKSIVTSHRGTIGVIIDGRRPGATIRISLPRKRSRSTVHAD
jgi:signal transduction histidine kinase